jgi:hypothetical protein
VGLLALGAMMALSGMMLGLRPQPALGQATQEPTSLKNVTLWINPEYDDPRLLVMLEGTIVGAEAPARIRFLVPSTAEMFSAGSKDWFGTYTGGPPDRKASSMPGWDEISYIMTTNVFRVEYYDSLPLNGTERTIPFQFIPPYRVIDLTVVAQEPPGSTSYTVTPDGVRGVDTDGLTTHTISMSGLEAGVPVKFDIAYSRTGTTPARRPGQTSGQTTLPASPDALSPKNQDLTGVLLVGVVFIGIVSLIATRFGKKKTRRARAYAGGGKRRR